MVENYSKENNLIFELLEITKYSNNKFSEEDARKRRYDFFNKLIKKYNANVLLTAHHGDDLIETIQMRLTRGSNLSGYIGIKMINESNNEEENNNSDLSIKNILLLGVATSIDALAVGIAYACAYGSNNAILTFTVIAIITFILSLIGVKIGSKFGSKYDKVAQIIGGIILILLGTNILLEHLKIL